MAKRRKGDSKGGQTTGRRRSTPPQFEPPAETLQRARSVAATYRVTGSVYLVGSLERGLTVYNQQVRAHNLIWALWELSRNGGISPRKIAIVGGGICGLTAAACAMSRFDRVAITLFEQRWDFCHLQQGSDIRWLHPRIYDWPAYGSRAPGASLPVLNWAEGRASDVARDVIRKFAVYCGRYHNDRLRLFLDISHLRLTAATNQIEWIGSQTADLGPFFRTGGTAGATERFDTIILAPGFGLESYPPNLPTASYWRNEEHGQPIITGNRQSFLISGFGDGALVDLFRLTIERFRQDTILYELFESDLDEVESELAAWTAANRRKNPFEFFGKLRSQAITKAQARLAQRLRKDTKVIMHLTRHGKRKITNLPPVFAAPTSFLNKLLFFLLYRCGAFSTSFSGLDATIARFEIPKENVICRHGTDSMANLLELFVDPKAVRRRFRRMKEQPAQEPRQFWLPGTFPHHSS